MPASESRGIMSRTTSTASCRTTRTFARPAAVDAVEQRADAGAVHLDRRGNRVSGCAAAMAAVVSPMPQPISSTTGADRGRTPRRSRAAPRDTACRSAAASSSSARCCAGDKRPWRSTKLRIARCARVAASACPCEAAPSTRRRASAGRRASRSSAAARRCPARWYSIARRSASCPRRGDVAPAAVGAQHAILAHVIARHAPQRDLVVAAATRRSRR